MEPEVSPQVEKAIASLDSKSQPLAVSGLVYLSDLKPTEMELFKRTWAAIKPLRRRQIINWLAEMAEDNVELNFDRLFRYCLKDGDSQVRSRAIDGLWENEEASLINPLLDLLEEDSSASIQASAATALGRFALLAELDELRSSHAARVGNALLAAVSDDSKAPEVRGRALEAAAPLSRPEVTSAISTAYGRPGFKASAIHAMGKNCSRRWLPVLLEELASTDAEVRYEAAACGELGDAEAVPQLTRLTGDPDVEVQIAAIQALGRIGGREAKKHLKRCLAHPGQAVHEAAELALDEAEAAESPLLFWRTI